MTKSFDDIISNNTSSSPEWQVSVNGKDYTSNLELLEFRHSINNSFKFDIKLNGIDSTDNIPENAEVVISYGGGELFRGVLKEFNPGAFNTYTFKGAGYGVELEGDSQQIVQDNSLNSAVNNGLFESTNIQEVVDILADSTNVSNSRVFSTSYSGGVSDITVNDFRVKDKQLSDINRLMGEYDAEWYITTDGSDNPVLNVTDQLFFSADSNNAAGNPKDVLKTYGADQSAKKVDQNINRNRGDFDGVLVRGYGDGDDQITAVAGTAGKDSRVLIYTDKTILSQANADRRAQNLADTNTVAWQEIEVKPSTPNKIYGIGDELRVESENARLSDNYRVVEVYYKIHPEQNSFESKLNLSNKPQTFVDDFKKNEEQTKSQTDYMQGARNVWGDKETDNATNAEPLEVDFQVPQDIIDTANKNRLSRVEFNYACKPFKRTAETSTVTASNFDPSTKVIDSRVKSAGVQMERSKIKKHEHAVGSSTTSAAAEIPLSGIKNFQNSISATGGWQKLTDSNGDSILNVNNPEKDLSHELSFEVTKVQDSGGNRITEGRDIQYVVISSSDTITAGFTYIPSSPTVGEYVDFVSTTSGGAVATHHWVVKDSGGGTVYSDVGDEITFAFSATGDYDVTLQAFEDGGIEGKIIEHVASSDFFVVEGDVSSYLDLGDSIIVDDSDGNDAVYTIKGVSVNGSGNTEVTVEENIQYSYTDNESTGRAEIFIEDSGYLDDSVTQTVSVTSTQSIEQSLTSQAITSTTDKACNPPEVIFQQPQDGDTAENQSIDIEYDAVGNNTGIDLYVDGSNKGEIEPSWNYEEVTIAAEGSTTITLDGEEHTIEFIGTGESNYGNNNLPHRIDGNRQDIDECEVYQIQNTDGETFDLQLTGFTDTPGGFLVDEGNILNDTNTADSNDTLRKTTDDLKVVTVGSSSIEYTINGGSSQFMDVGDIVNVGGWDVELFDTDTTNNDASFSVEDYEQDVTHSIGRVSGVHTYDFGSDGDYTLQLDMGNATSQQISITVDTNAAPTADFTFTPSNPDTYESVDFTDQSTDPDGDNTISKWEWDFGDGTTQTINSSPGDTTHTYDTADTYTVSLTVTDDKGATDTATASITVGAGQTLGGETVIMDSEENVAGSPSTVNTSNLETQNLLGETVLMSSSNNLGGQVSPGGDSNLANIRAPIPPAEMSSKYEVYVATQNDKAIDTFEGALQIVKHQHTHDVPRQDDFDDNIASVGAGAESKEVNYVRAPDDRGDVLLDFSSGDNAITLDTTLNGNDAAITVGNIDDDGNITNTERIPSSGVVSNGTATSNNTYSDEELYVRIEQANNKQEFTVEDPGVAYQLGAAAEERFRSSKTDQETQGVADSDGASQDVIEGISDNLLKGSQANNVKLYIDDDPDNDATNSEREITGALYNGASNSGKTKDKELSVNQSYSITSVDTGSNIFTVSGDTTGFMQTGDSLRVSGSSGNNGDYSISSTSYDSNNDETDITVNEDVTGSNADGKLEWRIVDETGWYRLKIQPDQASFVKSRVFLDHHKSTE